ncbi:MAG: universal stress protein [Synechococcales cyanobacterium RU_4_20]|nr:universal stress protein [Synechococcales cyanobacterium RU_4_20]NJR68119.1 universal stress protein [Synechococcales cyanobacterium CRU_2_2]
MAFRKILVALDRSEHASDLVEQAIDLAHREDSELHLMSCLQWAPSFQRESFGGLGAVPAFELPTIDMEMLQSELRRLQEMLEGYQAQAQTLEIKTTIAYDLGDPGTLICTQAKDWGADLVLLGRRGRSGLSELLMGSVSNFVLHHAPCSVLVVQGQVPNV